MGLPHGFWVSVTDNRVFDGVVTRHVAAHADIVAVHAFYASPAASFSDIVARLRAAGRGIRVLMYAWAGRKLLGGQMISAVPTLDGMEDLSGFLLKDAEGELITQSEGARSFIFLDPRVDGAPDWLRDRVSGMASDVGGDGVALDGAIRFPLVVRRRAVNPQTYPPAFDAMIQGISDATSLTIFNNLSTRPDQERLLAFTDGASIEFFGLNDLTTRSSTFDGNILPYLRTIGRHADKTFLVFGRASRRPADYTTYDDDWRWQRYLYCSYLLAAEPRTRWKQHAGFLASPHNGRAGGLDVYTDPLHDVGSPLGPFTVTKGMYSRAFDGGLVFVLPAESPASRTVSIGPGRWFTLDGSGVSGRITLQPGDGVVLLRRRPAPLPSLVLQFDADHDPLWRFSALAEESGAWHVHLERPPDGEEHEHDLALDLVRHRARRPFLTLAYRSADPSAGIKIVVEVDDQEESKRFLLVDGLLPAGGRNDLREAQFRSAAPPASQFRRLPVVGGGAPLVADGQWHTLRMDLEAAVRRSRRYAFRRAVFARLVGSMDVRLVRLRA